MVFSEDGITITKAVCRGDSPPHLIKVYELIRFEEEGDGVWEMRPEDSSKQERFSSIPELPGIMVDYAFEGKTTGLEGVEYYRYLRTPHKGQCANEVRNPYHTNNTHYLPFSPTIGVCSIPPEEL